MHVYMSNGDNKGNLMEVGALFLQGCTASTIHGIILFLVIFNCER